MENDLIELERQGRACRDAGEFERAIEFFGGLEGRQPDWERGMIHYELAWCFEQLGICLSRMKPGARAP